MLILFILTNFICYDFPITNQNKRINILGVLDGVLQKNILGFQSIMQHKMTEIILHTAADLSECNGHDGFSNLECAAKKVKLK